MIELGISTFGETTTLEHTGEAISHAKRLQNMIEEIKLADEVGLDIYAIGEHHRADFAVSAPEIVLAAGATVTKRIKLSPAVTVLSSQDPIRVYQQYATIDAISNGRTEIMVGRGSFTESFPLFGYRLEDYEMLFDEKLDLLKLATANEIISNWKGVHTQTLSQAGIYPRSVQKELPIWVATGGNVESTVKIAQQGLPIAYAIIGGNPIHFKPLINGYRKIGAEAGFSDSLKVASHSWGFVAETDEEAIEKYFYPTKQLVDAISKDRPFWKRLTKTQYMENIGPDGAMLVGSPETVAKKLIWMIETLGLDRFMLHLPIGSIPHEDTMKAIELFGTKVAPMVREYFKKKGE